MNTIQEQWASFESMVIAKDAPPVQRQEMRRAFYAGAEAMTRIQYALGDKAISEDAAMGILTGVHDELRRFAIEIAKGKA